MSTASTIVSRVCNEHRNSDLFASDRRILAAIDAELDALRAENARLRAAIERDRTALADAVSVIKEEINSRFWLTEGRGPYEWNDDRYREEFCHAARAILAAIKPIVNIAADLQNSPRDSAEVKNARRNTKDALLAGADALDELSRLRNLLRGLYEPDGCGNECNPTCAVCQVAKAVWQ